LSQWQGVRCHRFCLGWTLSGCCCCCCWSSRNCSCRWPHRCCCCWPSATRSSRPGRTA
jgi:hypothetical protein